MIRYYTWSRDSHGLFDYESKSVTKGQYRSLYPAIHIVRTKEEIKVFESLEEQKSLLDVSDATELLSVFNRLGRYVLESNKFSPQSEETEGVQEGCLWAVVKSITNKDGQNGYIMKEGDFIKLGRVRFRIREIKTSVNPGKNELNKMISDKLISVKQLDKDRTNTEYEENNDDDGKSKASQNENTCRICLGGAEPGNPLIHPCSCQGSVRFIHVCCLQKWLGNKLAPKVTKFSVSFVWKKFECEICKANFPSKKPKIITDIVSIDGNTWETVEIPKPAVPYITIEILSREKNNSKGTHIISLASKTQIKLGRGHDQDVRLTDISVSRFHAVVRFHNEGNFYLEDNRSKFGTLVLLRSMTCVGTDENNNLAVQIGRSVLSFQVKKEWKVGSCCFSGPLAPENPPDADEVQQIRGGDRDNIMMNRGESRVLDQPDISDEEEEEDVMDSPDHQGADNVPFENFQQEEPFQESQQDQPQQQRESLQVQQEI